MEKKFVGTYLFFSIDLFLVNAYNVFDRIKSKSVAFLKYSLCFFLFLIT